MKNENHSYGYLHSYRNYCGAFNSGREGQYHFQLNNGATTMSNYWCSTLTENLHFESYNKSYIDYCFIQ